MNEEQRADARQNGGHYVVNLKDRDDMYGEWFESDIEGSFDDCQSQVRELSLDKYYKIQIVER
tara:strand:- start:262 stop:450 length:189 start_codon:yes stop_codon:yes gene_type:complete